MKGKRFLNLILLSAAASAMPALRSFAQPAPTAAEIDQRELEQLRSTLVSNDSKPAQRDEAAKRLLQRGAYDTLHNALKSGDSKQQVSVARALAYVENPPAEFVNEVVQCLQPQITGDLAEAASLAATNYHNNPFARSRVRDFILSVNVSEVHRENAVRALGTLNDKDTAQFLMQILKGEDRNVTQPLSDTAADALVEMTGNVQYGRDYGQWNIWWAAQQAKSPQEFMNDRLVEREAAARNRNSELDLLTKSVNQRATDGHIPLKTDAEREQYVLSYLKDQSATFHAAGATLVKLERGGGFTVSQPVKARLRELIGDSSPDVRLLVAQAIASINDPEAAKPLLAQVQREKMPGVKAELINALAPSNDVSTVPELVKLLNDPSYRIAEATAKALTELGPEIAKNQALLRDVSNALVSTIRRTESERGANRLREQVVQAMSPLKDPELVQALFPMLEDRESNPPKVRIAAIHALSSMNASPQRQADIAIRISNTLARDGEKTVREAAATDLGLVGSPAQRDVLLKAMGPNEDPIVGEAAWKSLSGLLNQFDDVNLANLAETFKGAPDKQLVVNLAQRKKYAAAGNNPDELAVVEENIGSLCLTAVINKPDEAIPHLVSALAYWDGKGPGVHTEGIQEKLLDAYLRSKRYKDAAEFARGRIENAPAGKKTQNQESMGRRLLQEVEQLDKRNELRPALDLIADARTFIEGYYKDKLIQRENDIKGRVVPYLHGYRDPWIGILASASNRHFIIGARG